MCPGCHSVELSTAKLACQLCWDMLPALVQSEIRRTTELATLHPARREALTKALDYWKS